MSAIGSIVADVLGTAVQLDEPLMQVRCPATQWCRKLRDAPMMIMIKIL